MKLLVIGLCCLIISVFRPQLLAKNLESIDKGQYKIAIGIKNNPNFTKGEVKFLVCYNPFTLIVGANANRFAPDVICLSPFVIKSKNFDAIIAHELGHIEYGHVNNWPIDPDKAQIEADNFAAKIIGKKRLRDIRLADGFSRKHPLVKNLEN